MNFEIVSGWDVEMYEGQIIEYRVEFLRGLRSPWLTEIAHVREKSYFMDEQRIGPYRFWYHEHLFEPQNDGVQMTDHVSYAAPFGLLGDLINMFWIHVRLKRNFDFRQHKIKELIGG